MSRYDEAIASYYRAIALKPGYVDAYNNLGATLSEYKATDYSDQLADSYLDILNAGVRIQPIRLSHSIITLLKCHDTVKQVIDAARADKIEASASEFCIGLSKIPLFMKIIELTLFRTFRLKIYW